MIITIIFAIGLGAIIIDSNGKFENKEHRCENKNRCSKDTTKDHISIRRERL